MTSAAQRANGAAWQRRRRAAIAAGTWQPRRRDADPARAHLEWMRTLGVSPDGCAEAIGIPVSTIHGILYPDRGEARTFVTLDTERLILACDTRRILDRLPDGRHLSSIGSRRRVEALAVAGWSRAYIASRLGVTLQAVSAMLRRDRLVARNARAIRDLYDELSMRPGPSARTRRDAQAAGWLPALAWDDDTIDDPAAQPAGIERPGRRSRQVVVEQADDLARTRCTWEEAAARIGITTATLDRALRRAGRPDLIAALRTEPEFRVLPARAS